MPAAGITEQFASIDPSASMQPAVNADTGHSGALGLISK